MTNHSEEQITKALKYLQKSEGVCPQQRSIEAARILFDVTPVKLSKVPTWFKSRVRQVYGTYENCPLSIPKRCGAELSLWDHWGTSGDALVSEVYDFDRGKHKRIEEIADALDIDYVITPCSWWYPMNTVRIEYRTK